MIPWSAVYIDSCKNGSGLCPHASLISTLRTSDLTDLNLCLSVSPSFFSPLINTCFGHHDSQQSYTAQWFGECCAVPSELMLELGLGLMAQLGTEKLYGPRPAPIKGEAEEPL